mmetsp:Transcript_30308/g.84702  ORF Transcript_30308/g.84702 Transcript_30308/m.84702 type:complete len:261 (+) Transcript_30308:170-952(+)
MGANKSVVAAVRAGNNTDLEELLDGGTASPSEHNDKRQTGLHIACEEHNAVATKLLLEYGADILAKDVFGKLPIHVAAQTDFVEGVHLLVLYCRSFAEEALFDLINSPDKLGMTPLMAAATWNATLTVQALLEYDAQIGLASVISGKTAVHYAVQQNHREIVTLLLNFLADEERQRILELKSREGMTCMDVSPTSEMTALLKEQWDDCTRFTKRDASPDRCSSEPNLKRDSSVITDQSSCAEGVVKAVEGDGNETGVPAH